MSEITNTLLAIRNCFAQWIGRRGLYDLRPADYRLTYRTAFVTTGLDRTYHDHRFVFSFTF